MAARIRSVCASAASWESLPFLTRLAPWRADTSRALSRPVSTKRCSTSLRMTGMPAAAMTCAISPPITPAPTTAALKTNMAGTLASPFSVPLQVPAPFAGESGEGPLERRLDLAADEEAVDEPRRRRLLLELIVQLERDVDAVAGGLERDLLRAAQALVLDRERLAHARLIGGHLLEHAAAAARVAVPHEPALRGPALRERRDVLEAVDPRRPADRVVPERLGLGGEPGDLDRRRGAAHARRPSTSPRIASIERAMRSRRGSRSAAREASSRRPAS